MLGFHNKTLGGSVEGMPKPGPWTHKPQAGHPLGPPSGYHTVKKKRRLTTKITIRIVMLCARGDFHQKGRRVRSKTKLSRRGSPNDQDVQGAGRGRWRCWRGGLSPPVRPGQDVPGRASNSTKQQGRRSRQTLIRRASRSRAPSRSKATCEPKTDRMSAWPRDPPPGFRSPGDLESLGGPGGGGALRVRSHNAGTAVVPDFPECLAAAQHHPRIPRRPLAPWASPPGRGNRKPRCVRKQRQTLRAIRPGRDAQARTPNGIIQFDFRAGLSWKKRADNGVGGQHKKKRFWPVPGPVPDDYEANKSAHFGGDKRQRHTRSAPPCLMASWGMPKTTQLASSWAMV